MWYDNQRRIKCCIPFCAIKWDVLGNLSIVIFNRLVTFSEASTYYTSQIESQYMAANLALLDNHVHATHLMSLKSLPGIYIVRSQLCAILIMTKLLH